MEKLTLDWLLKNDIIDIDKISAIRNASDACDYDFYGDTVEKWDPKIGELRHTKMKKGNLLKLNGDETITKISTDADGGIIIVLGDVITEPKKKWKVTIREESDGVITDYFLPTNLYFDKQEAINNGLKAYGIEKPIILPEGCNSINLSQLLDFNIYQNNTVTPVPIKTITITAVEVDEK